MLSKLFFLSLSCALIFGCKQTGETTQIPNKEISNQIDSETITQKDIQKLKFTDYGLSNKARDMVSSWQKYQELSAQLDFLRQADFSFYSSDVTLISTFLNDFETEIPKTLATNEILARITVLKTKMLMLNSVLLLDNISKQEKLLAIKELLTAFSNLNLQINKKLEFDTNNISKPE